MSVLLWFVTLSDIYHGFKAMQVDHTLPRIFSGIGPTGSVSHRYGWILIFEPSGANGITTIQNNA